jgi:hypothetical protein
MPPDVRRGYASPLRTEKLMGYAPGSGSALKVVGQRPYQGHSPTTFLNNCGEA